MVGNLPGRRVITKHKVLEKLGTTLDGRDSLGECNRLFGNLVIICKGGVLRDSPISNLVKFGESRSMGVKNTHH